MRKYFLMFLKFLNRIRVKSLNQFNRLQQFTAVVILTTALILVAQQAQAFDIIREFENCFSGGCDPTRPEVIRRVEEIGELVEEAGEIIESVDWEEITGYYTNPTSAYRALWGEFANVADTALNGIISRNFGHVTNKWALRSALESEGIVIYGLEISQDEYIQATRATAASVATSNPAPLIQYFLDFATRSYGEMLLNSRRAIEEASGQYTEEIRRLQNALTPQFIATALATYVSTGEIPQFSFNVNLSRVNVRFGILTYSRGERYPGGVLVTPNTHQPYVILTPPTLSARVEQILRENTVPRNQVVTNPYWSNWESLGGTLASGPDASSWGDRRLDVFARSTDNTLVHKWFDGNGWSNWESLGGQLSSDPTAVSWGTRRIDVFARSMDNTLVHKWFDSNGWSNWESLGGTLASGPDASSWGDRRLDVFARSTDNTLVHKWFDGNGWSNWESLGGQLSSDPTAVSWGTRRIDVFARSMDNTLVHKWFDSNGWSNWESLGGTLASSPDVSSWGDRRLDVFARGTDNTLVHKWLGGSGWSNWESLGGQLSSDPTAASWGTRRIDVFARSTDNTLVHKWFDSN